jgi:hypothetical protein
MMTWKKVFIQLILLVLTVGLIVYVVAFPTMVESGYSPFQAEYKKGIQDAQSGFSTIYDTEHVKGYAYDINSTAAYAYCIGYEKGATRR